MRILLLTFYYPPDLSAGSFRALALVEALAKEAGEDLRVDVITSMPNRYHSMVCSAETRERTGKIQVHRIDLPRHKNKMLDQAKAFASYALKVHRKTENVEYDGVVATSSRLMTAALGAWIANLRKITLYLDVRDMFTDTMDDLLQGRPIKAVLPVFKVLERWTLKSAQRVNVVSPGMLPHMSRILPRHEVRAFTNGIDDDFLKLDFSSARNEPPLIVYAGNMGDGQGLHKLIPKAAHMLGEQANFRLIGDGACRELLKKKIEQSGLTNVDLLPPVPRKQLYKHYCEADYLLLHLNDHAIFHQALPSKLFEYAATGKPILAGVSGYAVEFLSTEVPGAEVFAPCDAEDFVRAFKRIEGEHWVDREVFKEKFARRLIMQYMAKDILRVMEQKRARHG